LPIDKVAERTHLRARSLGLPQHLRDAQRSASGMVFFFNAIPATFLAYVLAQQLPVFRGDEPTSRPTAL
jgi:hypothetical protein